MKIAARTLRVSLLSACAVSVLSAVPALAQTSGNQTTSTLNVAPVRTAGQVAAPSATQTPAQTPPAQRPGSDLTRSLNGGPPARSDYLAPPPVTAPTPAPTTAAPVRPATTTPVRPSTTVPAPTAPARAAPAPAPRASAPTTAAPRTTAPTTTAPVTAAPRVTPPAMTPAPARTPPAVTPAPGRMAPASPAPAPRTTTPQPSPQPNRTPPATTPSTTRAPAATAPATTAPVVTPRPPAPTPAPTPGAGGRIYAPPVLPGSQPPVSRVPIATPPVSAPVEPTPAPPVMTTLGAPAVAALPFRIELPQGFRITTGRPGPDFNIYSIRRGDEEFAMVYVGPSSQFPIYDGQMVQAGGRASIVVTENGQRHAMEHLFQRTTAPKEIHVWVSSLEGADELLAERIAQSVDAK